MAAATLDVNSPSLSTAPVMSDAAFGTIRDAIFDFSGMHFQTHKRFLFAQRLLPRLNALRLSTFDQYAAHLRASDDRANELQAAIGLLASPDPFFFSQPSQLRALAQAVAPMLVRQGKGTRERPIQVWSAACLSGEEPYGIAITLQEQRARIPAIKDAAIEILATDLSESMLQKARDGVYSASAMRSTDPNLAQRYFSREGGRYALSPEIRPLVEFRQLNLFNDEEIAALPETDVVFCRSVLIYFTQEARKRAVAAIFRRLAPGGLLFLGERESLNGVSDDFKLAFLPGAMAYVKPQPKES